MFRRLVFVLVVLSFAVGYSSFFEHSAKADIGSCSAQINPQSVAQGSSSDFHFQITNNDTSPIKWIRISAPSTGFILISSDAPGWNSESYTHQAWFTVGTISPGDSFNQIIVNAFITGDQPTDDWIVQVSDDPGGANPFACTGDLGTAIVPPPPVISNIFVIDLTPKSVTIQWDTDVDSTSQVNYGLDSSYGQSTAADSNPVSSHSVKLTNLKSNTGYHFQVVSATADGGATATSNDSTFLTAIQEASAPPTASAPIAIQITNPGDKIPPLVSLITKLPHVVQYIPTLQGTATDDLAVTRIEYSTDNGRNWLPVDSAPDIGGKIVAFAFTPSNLDDGNYLIMARAIDAGGNIATTATVGVVIDRLPPLVGGSVVSLGPQVLTNTNGVILTQAGVDEKITLSAVGGPTSINLTTEGQSKAALPQTFSLGQSRDSGLWSGIISFKKAGTYTLMANSIDGAGNKTTKQISKVSAVPAGQITDSKTKKPISGQLTIYTMQPDSSNWIVWDGSPYSQSNPQPVGQDGQFSFLLPAGKYYLSASAAKHLKFMSDIFQLTQPSPLSTIISLKPGHDFKLLSWLNWSSHDISLNTQTGSKNDSANKLIGNLVPGFSLKDLDSQTIHAVDLLGKPTDLVFLNTWAPTTSEQLPALNSLTGNNDIYIKLVAAQENAARLSAYNEISGYNLNWLVDPDSITTQSFATPSLPTHYFVDRNGTVKHVVSGVLSKKQILSELSGL